MVLIPFLLSPWPSPAPSCRGPQSIYPGPAFIASAMPVGSLPWPNLQLSEKKICWQWKKKVLLWEKEFQQRNSQLEAFEFPLSVFHDSFQPKGLGWMPTGRVLHAEHLGTIWSSVPPAVCQGCPWWIQRGPVALRWAPLGHCGTDDPFVTKLKPFMTLPIILWILPMAGMTPSKVPRTVLFQWCSKDILSTVVQGTRAVS